MNDKANTKLEPLNGEPYRDRQAGSRVHSRTNWKRRLLFAVLLIETCLVLPKYAHAQFLGIFNSIFSSIQSDIGSSLSQINQIMQQTQKLYQTTVALPR